MTNEETTVETQQPTGTVAPETKTTQVENKASEVKPDRMFSRDEVTKIVKARQDRFSKTLCERYGVADIKALDELYNKHKDYDSVISERDNLKSSHASMTEELAFLSNKIDPNRYDDVRTYFKGKGQMFDKAILAEVIKTHPEWVTKQTAVMPKTTIQRVGTGQSSTPIETAEAKERRIFGDL